MLTEGTAYDAAQVPDLLGWAEGTIASVITDGACDSGSTYTAAAARQRDPSPNMVVPLRASAVRSTGDPAKQSPARPLHPAR